MARAGAVAVVPDVFEQSEKRGFLEEEQKAEA